MRIGKNFTLLCLFYVNISFGQQYIIKNRGNFFLYENRKIINSYIDLNSYYGNAFKINETMIELNKICSEIRNFTECDNYRNYFADELASILNNVYYFRGQNIRRKRSIGKWLMKLVAGNIAVSGISWSVRNEVETNNVNNIVSKRELLQVQNDSFHFQNEINRENILFDAKIRKYHELMHSLTLLKLDHREYTQKYKKILNGQTENGIFDVINYANFSLIISETNGILAPNQTLPKINNKDLFKLSDCIASINGSHIILTIKIPIIETSDSKLFEIIPIPTQNNGKTMILDMKPTFFSYGKSNEILLIPREIFNSCKIFNNITICNSTNRILLETPNECINTIVAKKTINCNHKVIANRNHLIRTGENAIYCYILNPIKMKISCDSGEKFFNLTHSMELKYDQNCNVFHIFNESYNVVSKSEIIITQPFLETDFSNYEHIFQNWTLNMSSTDNQQIIFLNTEEKIRNLSNNLNKNSTSSYNIIRTIAKPFDLIVNSINDFEKTILVFIILPICVYFTLYFACCVCRKK